MTVYELHPAATDRYTAGRTVPIDRIIIHTSTTTYDKTIAVFQGGPRLVSAHYVVDKNVDRIAKVVDEADTAWHAGYWPMNQRSIGIEHVDDGDFNGPRPDGLYARSAALVRDVCLRYHIPIDEQHILPHNRVAATTCPDALDVNHIIAQAAIGGDMTPDEVKQIVQTYIAQVYGPLLEIELNQLKLDTIAAAVKAVGTKLTG